MSKLGDIARFAVGAVIITTLWPIGLFGSTKIQILYKRMGKFNSPKLR